MYEVIVNGADENGKQLRKKISVDLVHWQNICDKAFEQGYFYVNSYRYNGITVKIA